MMKSIFYSVLIFITFIQSNAQCGWVGQLNFPAGPINEGSEYLVNVQVYQAGVTPPGGQGANISCYAHFGSVSTFGGAWSNVQTLTMTYDKDTGNNDEYKKKYWPKFNARVMGIYLLLQMWRLARSNVGRYECPVNSKCTFTY